MAKEQAESTVVPDKKYKRRTILLDKTLDVLMQIFGMGLVVQGTNTQNQISFAYAVFILTFNVVAVLIINLTYNLKVNYTQNSLTRTSFWLQYYGKIIVSMVMIYSIIKNKDLVYRIKKDIASLETVCTRYKKDVKVTRKFTLAGIIIPFTTVVVMILFDLFNNAKNQNFFLVWTAYIPGLTIIVFVAFMTNLKRHVSAIFVSLNAYLNDFVKEMPWQKKLMMRVRPNVYSDETIEVEKLHHFFVVHNNTFKLITNLNQLFSFGYLVFMVLCLHGTILFIYLNILDLVRIRTNQGIFVREHHFTEYWTVMYMVALFMILLAAHKVNESGNEASNILHNIRSIYYNLNEYSSVYAFQLMFTKVNVNADSFFSLDYSTLLSVLGITIKYVFILMQFDQGVDMYLTEN